MDSADSVGYAISIRIPSIPGDVTIPASGPHLSPRQEIAIAYDNSNLTPRQEIVIAYDNKSLTPRQSIAIAHDTHKGQYKVRWGVAWYDGMSEAEVAAVVFHNGTLEIARFSETLRIHDLQVDAGPSGSSVDSICDELEACIVLAMRTYQHLVDGDEMTSPPSGRLMFVNGNLWVHTKE